MKISKSFEYAVLSLFHLARSEGNVLIQLHTIARSERIPLKFLEHIMGKLKHADLVYGEKGRSGGYRLAKRPHEINLANIAEVVEHSFFSSAERKKMNDRISRGDKQMHFYEVVLRADNALKNIFQSFTLQDMLDREQELESLSTGGFIMAGI